MELEFTEVPLVGHRAKEEGVEGPARCLASMTGWGAVPSGRERRKRDLICRLVVVHGSNFPPFGSLEERPKERYNLGHLHK